MYQKSAIYETTDPDKQGELEGATPASNGIKCPCLQRPQSREWGPFGKDDFSAYHALFNHSKRSISLDLAAPEAKRIVMDLVKEADVVIENFKVGTLDRLGIIYGSVSGFGMEGPLRDFACYDITAAARIGLMDRSGESNGAPVRLGFPHRFPAAKIDEHAPEILFDLGCALESIAELKDKNVFFLRQIINTTNHSYGGGAKLNPKGCGGAARMDGLAV